jgi:hypothetical protein
VFLQCKSSGYSKDTKKGTRIKIYRKDTYGMIQNNMIQLHNGGDHGGRKERKKVKRGITTEDRGDRRLV